jgi:biotin transport system substrate-specific component
MSQALTQHSTARARSVAFCGLSIALMAVAAWVTVPFGPVPFTLQTLAVMFVLFALPPKLALVAIGGYLVLGGIGLPVFSSFKGGLAALLGPTGGFIVGFFVAGAIALGVDALVKRTPLFSSEKETSFFGTHMAAGRLARNLVMGVVFLVVLYVFGWAWLMVAGSMSAEAAFAAAVAPFVLIDLLKMVAAVLVAQAVSAVVK